MMEPTNNYKLSELYDRTTAAATGQLIVADQFQSDRAGGVCTTATSAAVTTQLIVTSQFESYGAVGDQSVYREQWLF